MKQAIFGLYRFLFARKITYKLNKFLLFCCLKGMGMLNHENDEVSGERSFIAMVAARLKLETVFDVGGHKGEYAQMIREVYPDARICSFEPHPTTFKVLEQMAHTYRFECYNFGLGDVERNLELFDYAQQDGSPFASIHRAALDNEPGLPINKYAIQIKTLDDFVSVNQIDSIDLLKIDTEGNEYAVLSGGKNTLSDGKIKMIQFEFNEMNVHSRVFFKDFYDLLSDKYNIYRLLPQELLPLVRYTSMQCELFVYQNIVAIRKDIDNKLFQ
ncbi:FkbM family methyltransferase [Geobacter sp. FeAm09]|uniref:FkbM family methyltransferase n=1 Tax=Geobacter sp. FeAm09 TaxID=2597769 RepID=UPI00143D1517|nr:FkbM family methyltransferase [Geobacter sp. FeAm09]